MKLRMLKDTQILTLYFTATFMMNRTAGLSQAAEIKFYVKKLALLSHDKFIVFMYINILSIKQFCS